jgi:hypothetical protein
MSIAKPYEIEHPLNREQVAYIDDMLRILFDNTGGFTGILPASSGGTGFGTFTIGDILYADTTTTLALLSDVATGNALLSGGVGQPPFYGKIGLTTHVDGTLPVANGGTGFSSYTAGDMLYASGVTTLAKLPIGASGTVMQSDGTAPFWDVYFHNLLSEPHSDTIPADPVLGDLIVALQAPGATDGWLDGLWGPGIGVASSVGGGAFWVDGLPMEFLDSAVKWQRFGIGAAGTVLTSNGSVPEWI